MFNKKLKTFEKQCQNFEEAAKPPYNFGWLVAGVLAGSGRPQVELELRYLLAVGINHVVTLSPGIFNV